MTTSAHEEFQARLDRIRSNGGQSLLMVGQDEHYLIPRKEIVPVSRKAEIAGNLVYPASLLGAILLGMVAVFASHYIRFQVMAGAAADPDHEMLVIGGLGIVSSFVLSQAFKLTTKEHRSLQGVGVFLMVCLFHNLSHWAPAPMSLAFSSEYVQQITAASPANSFQFRGKYFPLFTQHDPAAPALPDPAEPTTTESTGTPPNTTAPNATVTDPAPAVAPESGKLPVVRKAGKIVQGG